MSVQSIQHLYNRLRVNVNQEINNIIDSHRILLTKDKFHNLIVQLKKVNALIRNENTNIIKYKSRTLDQIYDRCVTEHNKRYPPKLRKNAREPIIRIDTEIQYPFKSKVKYLNEEDNTSAISQP
jgi:hypothetical protein